MLTTPYLIPDLKSDEGFRAHAYPDLLSGGEPYTVGYGATGYVIGPNTVWTEAEADADLEQRVGMLCTQLTKALPWFKSLAGARQDVLVNMGYNLGLAGLLGFHNTLTFIQAQDWQGAHDNMLASLWAKQVPNRAKRLAEQMLTGLVASVIRPKEPIVTDTGNVTVTNTGGAIATMPPADISSGIFHGPIPAPLVAPAAPTVVADINTLKPLIIAAAQEISSGPVTVSAILTDTKSIWSSKTFYGLVVAGLAAALQQLGYTFTSGDQNDLIQYVSAIVGAGGMIFAMYGRIVATKALK